MLKQGQLGRTNNRETNQALLNKAKGTELTSPSQIDVYKIDIPQIVGYVSIASLGCYVISQETDFALYQPSFMTHFYENKIHNGMILLYIVPAQSFKDIACPECPVWK